MIPHILRWLTGPRGATMSARRHNYHPSVDTLEERLTPTTYQIAAAAGANSATTFTTLSQAAAVAVDGDIIEILAGSNPGSAIFTQNNLTLIGDASLGAPGLSASGTQVGSVVLDGINDRIIDLPIASLTIAAGSTGQTIADCQFYGQGIVQSLGGPNAAFATSGGNTIIGNTFLSGATVSLGGTPGSFYATAANDTVNNNAFWDPAGPAISVQNETAGLTITNNRISGTDLALPQTATTTGGLPYYGYPYYGYPAYAVPSNVLANSAPTTNAFIAVTDSVGTIAGNILNVSGTSGSIGILAQDGGNVATQTTNLTIANNVVTTNQIAIQVQHSSASNSFAVALTNNTVAGSLVGLSLVGNNAANGSDYGTLAITGNDFRGFSGINGNFAITASDSNAYSGLNLNTSSSTSTVTAEGNIFSAATPANVVSSATAVNTAIDVSNPLTGGKANLTAMFDTLGGGPPTAAQLTAASGVSAAIQGQVAATSAQAAKVFVDQLYVSLLGRMAGTNEDLGWITNLTNGTMNQEEVIVGFLTSGEYYTKVAQSSANPGGAWLSSLYANLLGRAASAVEISGWLPMVASEGLGGIAQSIVNSAEFRSIQVAAMYGGGSLGLVFTPDILKRQVAPAPAEVNAWITQGYYLRNIEAHILSSAEFASYG